MKKQKQLLILSILFLSLLNINYVSAKNSNKLPTPSSKSNLLIHNDPSIQLPKNQFQQTTKDTGQGFNPVPSLVQQEIEKIRSLNKENKQLGYPDMNNTGEQMRINIGKTIQGFPNVTNNQNTTTENNQIKEKRSIQIKKHIRNVAKRFGTLIARENQIKNRIQTRITKLIEEDFDMSTSTQALSEVENKLKSGSNKIQSMIENIITVTESIDTELNIEELFESIKAEIAISKEGMKEAHIQMIQIVKMMRNEINKVVNIAAIEFTL